MEDKRQKSEGGGVVSGWMSGEEGQGVREGRRGKGRDGESGELCHA